MKLEVDDQVRRLIAPTGRLRASINLGNPILAGRRGDGTPFGISVDLAELFGKLLNLPVKHLVFESAAKSVEAVSAGRADVGFFAIDPSRETEIAFTAPYVLIEGAFVVRQTSDIQSNDDVDRQGNCVVVGGGSAYDLYLSRSLEHADLIRAETSHEVTETFLRLNAQVAAGVRQQLESDIKIRSGLRMLPGRFMVIRQAMGMPNARGADAAAVLKGFVESAKSSGFVAESMARHCIFGANVAPLTL